MVKRKSKSTLGGNITRALSEENTLLKQRLAEVVARCEGNDESFERLEVEKKKSDDIARVALHEKTKLLRKIHSARAIVMSLTDILDNFSHPEG